MNALSLKKFFSILSLLLLVWVVTTAAQTLCPLEIKDAPAIRGLHVGMNRAEVEAVLRRKLMLTRLPTFIRIVRNGSEYRNLAFLFDYPNSAKVLALFRHELKTYDEDEMLSDLNRQIWTTQSERQRTTLQLQKSILELAFQRGEMQPELSIWVSDNLASSQRLAGPRLEKTFSDVETIELQFYDGRLSGLSVVYKPEVFGETTTRGVFEAMKIPKEFIPNKSILLCNGFKVSVDLWALISDESTFMGKLSNQIRITVADVESERIAVSRATQKLLDAAKSIRGKEEATKKPFRP